MKTQDTAQLIEKCTGKKVAPEVARVLEQIIVQGDKFEQMGRNDGFRKSGSKAEGIGLTLAKRAVLNDIAFSNDLSAYMRARYIDGYKAGEAERHQKRGQPREN